MDRNDYDLDLPESNSVFKLQSYWEERFKKEDSYEWLVTWRNVETQIKPLLRPEDRILVVGCGNSRFSADLYDAGFHNIVNIDFAESVIERMRAVHADKPMEWVVMDMTKMTFPDASFDVVIDKAAMDALVVDEGDVWDPEQHVVDSVDAMCLSVARVMKPHSKHLQISFAQPHFRTKYLMGYRAEQKEVSPYDAHRGTAARYGWALDHAPIAQDGGCLNSFLYIMTRDG